MVSVVPILRQPPETSDTTRYKAVKLELMTSQGPAYAIDSHPQKDVIVKRILDGLPCRKVVSGIVPHVSHSTIQRYKVSVIKPILARSAQTERIILGDPPEPDLKKTPIPLVSDDFVRQTAVQAIQDAPAVSIFRQRHQKAWDILERTTKKAESAVRMERDEDGNEVFAGPDLSPIAPLINQMHKSIEILGRATGELEPTGGSSISIQVVLPGIGSQHEEPRISFASADAIEVAPELEAGDGLVEIGVLQKG